jgi:uncharacterized damage-inducible protein DinB
MTYYGAKDLAAGFRTVRKNTLVIAEEIGEEHYGFQATPHTRTVASTLVHIALTPKIQEQIHAVEQRSTLQGFDFPAFVTKMTAEEQKARDKKQIIALLRDDGESFAKWLDGLSDDFLDEQVAYPAGMTPPSKSRFEMILGVKEHEMHHRGQLMLLERMIGMVPHLTREMQARFVAAQSSQASG